MEKFDKLSSAIPFSLFAGFIFGLSVYSAQGIGSDPWGYLFSIVLFSLIGLVLGGIAGYTKNKALIIFLLLIPTYFFSKGFLNRKNIEDAKRAFIEIEKNFEIELEERVNNPNNKDYSSVNSNCKGVRDENVCRYRAYQVLVAKMTSLEELNLAISNVLKFQNENPKVDRPYVLAAHFFQAIKRMNTNQNFAEVFKTCGRLGAAKERCFMDVELYNGKSTCEALFTKNRFFYFFCSGYKAPKNEGVGNCVKSIVRMSSNQSRQFQNVIQAAYNYEKKEHKIERTPGEIIELSEVSCQLGFAKRWDLRDCTTFFGQNYTKYCINMFKEVLPPSKILLDVTEGTLQHEEQK